MAAQLRTPTSFTVLVHFLNAAAACAVLTWTTHQAHAQTRQPEGAAQQGVLATGAQAYAPAARHFSLDPKTRIDLELDSLVTPTFTAYAPTVLGRNRLTHLLAHPFLDAQHIRARQAAVLYLADRTELRNALGDAFRRMARYDLSHLLERYESQTHAQAQSLGNQNLVDGMAAAMAAVTAPLIYLAAASGPDFTRAAGMLAPFAQIPVLIGMSANSRRLVTGPLGRGLRGARNGSAALADVQDPLLQTLAMRLVGGGSGTSEQAELSRLRQALQISNFWAGFQDATFLLGPLTRRFSNYLSIRSRDAAVSALSALAELEALYAASEVLAKFRGQVVLPAILDGEHGYVAFENAHHPYIAMGQSEIASTGNSALMDTDPRSPRARTLILTGINTGGKTTFLRTTALVAILGQAGLPVPADSASMTPMAIVTNFHVIDATQRGSSTFASQSARIGEIFRAVRRQDPTLVLADEILVGTSPPEHQAAERAVLAALHAHPRVMTILATHDRSLTTLENEHAKISNVHVSPAGHHVVPGPATDYNAFDVMEDRGVPADVVAHGRALFGRIMSEGFSTAIGGGPRSSRECPAYFAVGG